VEGKSLDTLRIIGTVGEPINPEAWLWYHKVVGRARCSIVDTYWQTETGSIVCTPLPAVHPTIPGSACFPFFGIELAILDPHSGKELTTSAEGPPSEDITGVLAIKRPFPSITRTVYGDHERYIKTYLAPYKGYYFTGDGATRDKDGYFWIRGRVDDVINVSGHRLSTAEVESALVHHPAVAEAAVVGGMDELTGQAIYCFVSLKPSWALEGDVEVTGDVERVTEKVLINKVRSSIGAFATPKRVFVVHDLPKTRSGKIMRRILRKIVDGEQDSLGDLSTLADSSVIPSLIASVHVA